MKRRTLVRIGTLAFSLVLLGSYVAYRAAAGKPAPQPQQEALAQPVTDVLPSSKSAAVFKPESPPPAAEQFLGGSKSVRIVSPSDVEPKPKDPPAQAPKPPDR